MTNIIKLNDKRQSPPIIRIVNWILSHNQTIVIDTSSVEKRLRELEIWFPDARLEVVDMGIRISNG
jgi:hypothetical protein